MRKLATIRTINLIKPHPNADRLEIAIVDGWQVVVLKDQYQRFDPVIFCEIDSFLPVREELEFLRKSCYRKVGNLEGFRVKSVKLRGELSQGLVLPMSILPKGEYEDRQDVTSILGVLNYNTLVEEHNGSSQEGMKPFPSFLEKTDEERIQNITNWYDFVVNDVFYATEKLDGSSMTVYHLDGHTGVCSRNKELTDNDNLYHKVAESLGLKDKLNALGKNICIQGELIGPKIQGNPYGLDHYEFKVFSICKIGNGNVRFSYDAMLSVCYLLGLSLVPYLGAIHLHDLSPKQVLSMADKPSALNPKTEREGIVFRSTTDRSKSFKVISNKFLLKHE